MVKFSLFILLFSFQSNWPLKSQTKIFHIIHCFSFLANCLIRSLVPTKILWSSLSFWLTLKTPSSETNVNNYLPLNSFSNYFTINIGLYSHFCCFITTFEPMHSLSEILKHCPYSKSYLSKHPHPCCFYPYISHKAFTKKSFRW